MIKVICPKNSQNATGNEVVFNPNSICQLLWSEKQLVSVAEDYTVPRIKGTPELILDLDDVTEIKSGELLVNVDYHQNQVEPKSEDFKTGNVH